MKRIFIYSASKVLYVLFRVFRKLKFPISNYFFIIHEKLNISIVSDERVIALIGDKSHKLLQEALGQKMPNNRIILEELLREADDRKLNSKIINWGKDTFQKYNNGTLIVEEMATESGEVLEFNQEGLDAFYKIAHARQSIRNFKKSSISKDIINKILSLAIEAPCSCNRQSWRFAVIQKQEDRTFIAKMRNVKFIESSPVIICVLVDGSLYNDKQESEVTSIMDASAAIMNILNAASAANLGSVWINLLASMSKDQIQLFKNKFDLPKQYLPIGFVAMGEIASATKKPTRDDLDKYCIYV